MAATTTKPQTQQAPPPPAENLPVPRPGAAVQPIVPQSWQEITAIASAICRAGMAPKSYLDRDNNPIPEKVAVAIMHGLEVGFTPMAALQSIAVVNGMPSLYGDGLLAVVRASGLLEDIVETDEWDKEGPLQATCRVKRRGESTWGEMKCHRADAQKAGWWGKAGPWSATPHRMLQMRARGWALRDKFADVLRGLRSAEEVQDMVDVTPQGSATTAAPTPEPRRSDYEQKADAGAPTSPQGAQQQAGQSAGSVTADAAGGTANAPGQPAPAKDDLAIPAGLDRRKTAEPPPPPSAKPTVTDVTDENDNPFGGGKDDIPFGESVGTAQDDLTKHPKYDDPTYPMKQFVGAKAFMTAFEEFLKLPECGPKNAQRWMNTYAPAMKAIYARRDDEKFADMAEFLDTLAGVLEGIIAKGKPR